MMMWTRLLLCGLVAVAQEELFVSPVRCSSPESRVCEGRRNWILVTDQHTKGIGDRSFVIQHFGALADAVCARMVIGEPSKLLGYHDTGTKVKAGWDEYANVKNGDDEALLTAPSASTMAEIVDLLEENKKNQDYYIDSNDGDMRSQFRKAWSIYSKRDNALPFVWHISEYYYRVDNTILREVEYILRDCRPIVARPSKLVQKASDRFVEKTIPKTCQQKNSTKPFYLLTFHLRRGDVVSKCDTSAEAVVDLARCATSEIHHVSPSHVVLFTDDTSDDYKNGVVRRLTTLFNDTTCIFFGDDYIPALIEEDFRTMAGGHHNGIRALRGLFDVDPNDNYLMYRVTGAVRARADLDLEKRRTTNCETCETLRLKKNNMTDEP